MLLFIQCIVLCAVFTLLILPPLFKNPLSQIVSYPPAIRKRVENLPQYRDIFAKTRNKNILKKIFAAAITVFLAAGVAYLSGKTGFSSAFVHTFVLMSAVNLYDLLILDFLIFTNCKG